MNNRNKGRMKTALLAICAILAPLAFATHAHATVVRIHFSGPAGSGYADLTLANDPDANPAYPDPGDPAPATRYDPAGVLSITAATGSFNHHAITGVRPLNDAPLPPPPVGPEYLPESYSFITIPGVGDGDGVSYDNLFYPDGSTRVCLGIDPSGNTFPKYPFSGGFLDIFGIMFMLDNDQMVDLWSLGMIPPGSAGYPPAGGLLYGMKVFQPTGGSYAVLASSLATASVPEPGFAWLFGAGVAGLLAWRRSTGKRRLRRHG